MDTEADLLGERIAEQAAHLDAATHRLLADLRAFDALGGWHKQGARSCAHWLAWRVGWTLGTARQRVRVAAKLGAHPTTDDALRRGELSYSQVRAICRVVTPANEAMFLDYARVSTASQLETLCRKYATVQAHDAVASPQDDEPRRYVRRRDTDDGMVKLEAVLHPEEAELVWAMLDHAAKQLAREPVDDHLSAPDSAQPTQPSSPPVPRWARPPQSANASTGDRLGVSAEPSADVGSIATSRDGGSAGVMALSGGDRLDGSAEPSADVALTATSREAAAGSVMRPAVPAGDRLDGSAEPSADVAPTATSRDGGDAGVMASSLSDRDRLGGSAEPSADVDSIATSRDGEQVSLMDLYFSEGAAEPADLPELVPAEDDASTAYKDAAPLPSPAPGVPCPESPLRKAANAARRAFNRADALIAVAHAYLRGDRQNRAPTDVMLTIPASYLRDGATDPTDVGHMGDSCVSVETARRLSCDAGVIEVVEGENGEPLSVGRKRRTITGSLKRALLKRDTACVFPGCTHTLFLEGHHIHHWADGGETSLENSLLLCSHHHRHVHEYGFTIERRADGHPQFRNSHGLIVPALPARPAPHDLGWPHIRATNAPIEIGAGTFACRWDGSPMPYATAVSQLAVADGLS